MPEPLVREVELDTGPALSSLRDLDQEFVRSAQAMREEFTRALDEAFSAPVAIDNVDASEVGTAVEAAVQDGGDTPVVITDTDATVVESGISEAIVAGADQPAVVTGDASEVTDAIDGAITAAGTDITLSGDASEVTATLEDAISIVDTDVPITASVTADTSQAEADIEDLEGLANSLDAEVPVTADTAEAQKNIEDLGSSAEGASGGVGVLSGAVGGLTSQLHGAGEEVGGAGGGALSALGPEAIAAAGGVLIATESLKKFTEIGAEVIGVEQQFAATFGDFGEEVEHVDVGGLNTDLRELAISLGVNDEAALSAATRAGALFQTFGAGRQEAAGFTKELTGAAAVLTSVNPAAGDLTTILQNLTTAVATGRTRGLKRLGIEITPAEIEAGAAAIGKTTESLTATERQAIFVDQIMQQLNGRFGDFGDEIAKRQQNAQVQLAATRERIHNVIEALAVQIAPPILDVIQSLTPLIEGLIPLATTFGKALAFGIKIGVDQLALLIGGLGDAAIAIGNFIEEANQIPFVGRAIPDDVGDKIRDWGHGAVQTASQMHEGVTAATDFNAAASETGDAGAAGAAGMNLMTDAATELTPAQQEAADAVKQFVDGSISALPTSSAAFDAWSKGVNDAFKKVGEAGDKGPKEVKKALDELTAAADPQRLIENIQGQIQGIGKFQQNLQTLITGGFGNVVRFIAEKGPEVGGALAQALVDNPANAAALNTTLGDLDTAFTGYKSFIETQGGPIVTAATAEQARQAAAAYSQNLLLTPGVQQQIAESQKIIADLGNGVTITAGEAAQRTSDAWSEKFQTKPHTEAEMTGAEDAVTGSTIPGDAGAVASDASGTYGTNLDLSTPTSAGMQLAAQTLLTGDGKLQVAALSAGRSVGSSFTAGIAEGIDNPLNTAKAKGAARALVDSIEAAARDQAHSSSPSKLFAELGADLVAGLAIGMVTDNTAVLAAQQVIDDVSNVINDASLPSLALGADGAVSPQAAASFASGGSQTNSFNFDVVVNVNGAVSATQARTIGAQIADSAQVELLRRNVIARVRAAV